MSAAVVVDGIHAFVAGIGVAERAEDFDFESAKFLIDDRRDYGEVRHIAFGYLDGRLHALCFVETEQGIRVISFRKANAREATRHDKPQALD